MNKPPRVSVVIPFHWMDNWPFFLERCLKSVEKQTFKDYDIVLTHAGTMPVNSNRAITSARGRIVKLLYMDDYLYSEDALQHIVDEFDKGAKWVVSGCVHDDGNIHNPHYPKWGEHVLKGVNTVGSPSVTAFENNEPLLFDERMTWMLDLDFYRRMFKRYGEPIAIPHLDVAIGLGSHQMTQKLSDDAKEAEVTLFHGTTN